MENPLPKKLIFFINGLPVDYLLDRESDTYYLNAFANRAGEALGPSLKVRKLEAGSYRVEGTDDQNLIDQVIEDLEALN